MQMSLFNYYDNSFLPNLVVYKSVKQKKIR